MAKNRGRKLTDADFYDETDSASRHLDALMNSLFAKRNTEETDLSVDALPEEALQSSEEFFEKFPQEEFRQTLEDLVRDEKETVDGVMQDIENLGNGAYLRKYAEKYNISETEARNELFTNLSSQLNELGMKCINKTHYPMPREIKHIIRMDFYGTVKKPESQKLSAAYLKSRTPDKTRSMNLKDYDLSVSPTWMVFRQFRSFSRMEKMVKSELIRLGIPPEAAAHMNSYDFSDLMFKYFLRRRSENYKENFGAEIEPHNIHMFLGARARFIKKFITKNKDAFGKYLEMQKVDPRYAKALIKSMQAWGITQNIEVLEESFTPEIIEKLKKRKYDCSAIAPGQTITKHHVRDLRRKGLLGEIMIRDKNGELLTGPDFSVHHKVAVQDCGEKTNFAEVNLYKNLCLTAKPQHFIAHRLDKTITQNGRESYVSRIEFEPDVVFYGGFNKIFQIFQKFKEHFTPYFRSDILDNYQKNLQTPYSVETQPEITNPSRGSVRRTKKLLKKRSLVHFEKIIEKKRKLQKVLISKQEEAEILPENRLLPAKQNNTAALSENKNLSTQSAPGLLPEKTDQNTPAAAAPLSRKNSLRAHKKQTESHRKKLLQKTKRQTGRQKEQVSQTDCRTQRQMIGEIILSLMNRNDRN